MRAWYSQTAADNEAQWTAMYIDKSTNQPAFAFCVPLTNLTTPSSIPAALVYGNSSNRRAGGAIVGVACSGMYIEDSESLSIATPPDP